MKRSWRKWLAMGTVWMCLIGTGMQVHAEEYVYDELNRVIKVIYEDGSSVEYVYDKNGNITEVIVVDKAPDEKEEDESEEDTTEAAQTEEGENQNDSGDESKTGDGESEDGGAEQSGDERDASDGENESSGDGTFVKEGNAKGGGQYQGVSGLSGEKKDSIVENSGTEDRKSGDISEFADENSKGVINSKEGSIAESQTGESAGQETKEAGIIETIVTAIMNFFARIIQWFKDLFA